MWQPLRVTCTIESKQDALRQACCQIISSAQHLFGFVIPYHWNESKLSLGRIWIHNSYELLRGSGPLYQLCHPASIKIVFSNNVIHNPKQSWKDSQIIFTCISNQCTMKCYATDLTGSLAFQSYYPLWLNFVYFSCFLPCITAPEVEGRGMAT